MEARYACLSSNSDANIKELRKLREEKHLFEERSKKVCEMKLTLLLLKHLKSLKMTLYCATI